MTATINAPATAKRGAGARTGLSLGAVPRVSLMPPELGARNKQLAIQRTLRLVMVLVLILVLGGIAGAWYLSFTAANALATETQRTTLLQAQRMEYADVDRAMGEVALGEAALAVGGSTEVDWQDYMNRVQASLPSGVTITSFSVEASNITTQYAQSSVPLQGARIATLQFSATSATIPEIPDWLVGLSALPGFVDANPNTVSAGGERGAYSASVTMHIDATAYSNRLVETEEDVDDVTDEEAAE
jgi:hypothetical protein